MERLQNKGLVRQLYFKNSKNLRKPSEHNPSLPFRPSKAVKVDHFSIGRFYVESVEDTFKCLQRLNPSIAKEMLEKIHAGGLKQKKLLNREEAAIRIQSIFRGILREIAEKEEEEQNKLDELRAQQEESQLECQRIEMEIKVKLDAERQSEQLRNYSATVIQQAFRKSRSSQVVVQEAVQEENEEVGGFEEEEQFDGEETAATLSNLEEQKEQIVQEFKDPSLSYDSFRVSPLCQSQIKISLFQSIDIPPKVISPVNSSQLFDLNSLRNDFEMIHRRAPSFNPPREHSNDQSANKENESLQQKKEVKSIENVVKFQRRMLRIQTDGNQELSTLKEEAERLILLINSTASELEGRLHEQRALKKKIAFSEDMLNFLLVRSTKSPKKKR